MYYRQWYVCNHQAELQFENVINKALCFHNRTWAKNLWWKHMCLYSCWISGQWLLWRMIPCFQSITHKPQFTFSLPWTITKRRQTSLLFPLKTRIRVDCVCVCVHVCVCVCVCVYGPKDKPWPPKAIDSSVGNCVRTYNCGGRKTAREIWHYALHFLNTSCPLNQNSICLNFSYGNDPCVCICVLCSVMSVSLWPHEL